MLQNLRNLSSIWRFPPSIQEPSVAAVHIRAREKFLNLYQVVNSFLNVWQVPDIAVTPSEVVDLCLLKVLHYLEHHLDMGAPIPQRVIFTDAGHIARHNALLTKIKSYLSEALQPQLTVLINECLHH